MKIISRSKAMYLLVSLAFLMTFALQAYAENNKPVEGPKTAKAIFDFRDSVIESALIHIKLIHDTYKDKDIAKDKPEFVVVFMGGSVNLLSKNRDKYSPEDQKKLEKIGEIITAMSKDGIRLEVCMFAANLFGLDPDSILPEIHQVENGWISSIRYQEKGYVLVPVF